MFLAKKINYFTDFLLLGNVFIALCAVAQAYQTCHIRYFSVAGSPLLFFIFAATFFLYNAHKFINLNFLKQGIDSQRFTQFSALAYPLSILTFCAAAIAFETFFILKKYARDAIVGIGTVSMLYILPVFRGRRLRDFYYLKIVLISLTWASVVVWIPTAAIGRGFSIIEVLMFLEKTAFIFAITLPFDIRDRASDAAAGLKTIPLNMGVEKTKALGFYAITLSLSITFALAYFSVYSVFHYFAIATTLVLSYFLIEKTDDSKPNYFYYFYLDGMMLLQTCLVLAVPR